MSLQIWLPLDGDLHNQGLKQVKIINNNTTFDANGKIGQCCNIASGQYLGFDAANVNNNKYPHISLAAWIYPTQSDSTERHIICCYENGGAGINLKNTKFGGQVYVGGYKSCYTPSTITINTWYHVCMTYNGSKLCLYLNGELVSSTTASGPITYHNTCPWQIAGNPGATAFGSNNFIGKINDLRMYDYALSQKEVKEIAKSLVRNYKLSNNSISLSNINPNILKGTYYNSYVGTSGGSWAAGTWQGGSGGNGTFSVTYDETCPVGTLSWNVKNNTSGNRDFQQLNQPYVANQQYTISFWAKGNGTCQLRSWNNTDGKAMSPVTKTWTLTSTWTYYTRTFTANAEMETDSCSFHLGVTGSANISICGMKMELGNTATPWTMTEEELAQFGFLNSNYEYDVSGYGKHAAVVGTITKPSDSRWYSAAANMNNTSSSNHIEAPVIGVSDNKFTVSLWVKQAKSTNQVLFADPKMVIGTLNSLIYVNPVSAAGFSTTNFKNNEWNHIVAIRNDSTFSLYINGEPETQNGANNYYLHNASALWLFNRSYNNNYAANTTMSDIRVYATVLSAADIKELYQTSASIDHNGNIYAREFDNINSSNKFQINHRGQMLPVDQFIEQEDQLASIKKNDDVLGGYFYEY